jgi:glycosyltransferase involved in cell wall biosynthesis
MKLVIISPFWNSGELTEKCILSLKNQYYTNFIAYFIDDMSTDNSYEIAKKTIDNDDRFILIKNNEKKYKTKNFIDIIRNNPKINWDDVIVELDGDDELSDNFVLGRLNKIFTDNNIWVCGTKWKDVNEKVGKYNKPNLNKVRKSPWSFSHLRSFRSFLFNSIHDDYLKYNGEYFKAACDLGHGIPILEMCGEEHFYYIDEPQYIYKWHDKQSYSNKTDFKDNTLQRKTAIHIYSLPPYSQIEMEIYNFKPIIVSDDNYSVEEVVQVVKKPKYLTVTPEKKPNPIIPKDFNPNKPRPVVIPIEPEPKKLIIQKVPEDRNKLIEIKEGSLADLSRKINIGKGRKSPNKLYL